MRKSLVIVLSVVAVSLFAAAVWAAEDKPGTEPNDLLLDESKDSAKEAPKPEPKAETKPEPKAEPKPEPKPESAADHPPAQTQVKKPAVGEPSYRVAKGLFLEANPGAFFTLLGQMGSSNAEPCVNAIFGWNFNADNALGLMLGFALNDNNAPKAGGTDATGKKIPASGYYADYAVTFLDLNYSHYFGVSPRLAIPVRVFGGGSFIANRYDPSTGSDKAVAFQPNGGLATGIQYATWQKHLQIGAEVAFFYLITDAVPAIALYPSLKYNF